MLKITPCLSGASISFRTVSQLVQQNILSLIQREQCACCLSVICCCLVDKPCPTLCNSMDCSTRLLCLKEILPEIFQARILEGVAISFCREFSWPMDWIHTSQGLNSHLLHWQAVSHQGSPLSAIASTQVSAVDVTKQGSVNIFHKESDWKYFQFCRPHCCCCNYSTLPQHHKSCHRPYGNEWIWLCFKRLYLQKQFVFQKSSLSCRL